MLAQLSPKERLGYALLAAAVLFGFGYIGAQHLKRPPDIQVISPGAQPVGPQGSAASVPAGASAPAPDVVVHVVGAVKSPQVVKLPSGSRVSEAIDKAGGALPEADLEAVNLAAKLEDGTQLAVPRKGAAAQSPDSGVAEAYRGGTRPDSPYRSHPQTGSGRAAGGGLPTPGSINLNTASAAELDRLPGVGPSTAAKILDYRRDHGGFTSVDELLAVKSIGPKKLQAMRKYVRVGP